MRTENWASNCKATDARRAQFPIPNSQFGIALVLTAAMILSACGASAAAPPSSAPATPAAAAASTKPAASTPASGKPAASAAASAAASGKPAASASAGTQAVPPISGPPAPAGATKLTAFYSTISATFTVMWLAKEAGLFQKNGLDVDVEYIQNPQGTAAMLANQVQLGLSGAADMLGPDASGADLTAYATFTKTYPYSLEVAPNIKTTDDLKGKKIGASQPGGSDYVALLAVLNKLGIDPAKDLSILFVGGLTQRTAAVLGGNVVGTLTSPPETLTLEKNGFHPLLDVTSLNLPSATSTLTAHKAWVQANKPTMQ
ncbi:MAG TPA: ABC transporter substrate-binding protein, partial [Chloroflexota bacterium]|nr:ABC transporter substrate-binding protein [Chloroflexota bacterium]